MKSEQLQGWLTLAANVGVLIGIVLLVAELSQNLTAARAQTRHDLSTDIVSLFTQVAGNEQLASLRRRADAGELLSPDEKYQYELITRAFFRYWEDVHYQYRNGLYDETEFSRQRDAWKAYAGESEALVTWWCRNRVQFSPDFAEEFDRILTRFTCS
jgi:hypothetical protein